jgi:hypothetical protein
LAGSDPKDAKSGTNGHRLDGNAAIFFGIQALLWTGRRNRLPHPIQVSFRLKDSHPKCTNSRAGENAYSTTKNQLFASLVSGLAMRARRSRLLKTLRIYRGAKAAYAGNRGLDSRMQ